MVKLLEARFRFIFLVLLVSLGIKLIRSTNMSLIINTTIFEFAALYIIYFIFMLDVWKENKHLELISHFSFYVVSLLISFISLAQAYYLDESLIRNYSILDLNFGVLYFGLNNLIPTYLIIVTLILVTVVLFLNFELDVFLLHHLRKTFLVHLENNRFIAKLHLLLVLISLVVVVIVPVTLSDSFTHPLTNNLIPDNSGPHIEVDFSDLDLIEVDLEKVQLINKQISDFNLELPENHRVLVFVMEEITMEDYEEDIARINFNDNFFEKISTNTHFYSNYYSAQQDSKTALQSVLYSLFIPYESYKDYNWIELFDEKIRSQDGLLELFNLNGYDTVFAISSVETPWVGGTRYHWDKRITIPKEDFTEGHSNYLCLHELQYQRACDDLKIIESVKEAILDSDKLFFLQEFVYGHTATYEKEYGLSPVEYYNQYLMQVYEFLEEENLLENTTILVVADHGSKSSHRMYSLEAYQIPLFVYNLNFEFEENSEIFSQVHLKDILLYELGVSDSVSSPGFTFMMGTTASNLMGYFESDERYFILDESKEEVEESSGMNATEILSEYAVFNAYRDAFVDDSVFIGE